MKTFRKFLMLAGTTFCCSLAAGAKPASAATVECKVHATQGHYNAYLFRTGDALPTATILNFIIDGGKVVAFSGVSGGHYFIRVKCVDDPEIVGQTPDGYLFSYFSTPLWLNDLYLP